MLCPVCTSTFLNMQKKVKKNFHWCKRKIWYFSDILMWSLNQISPYLLFSPKKRDSLSPSAGCGGELFAPSGSLNSPNYPNRYPSNRECIWHIHTTPGSSISITILEFDVEYHPDCNYDKLEVRPQTCFWFHPDFNCQMYTYISIIMFKHC